MKRKKSSESQGSKVVTKKKHLPKESKHSEARSLKTSDGASVQQQGQETVIPPGQPVPILKRLQNFITNIFIRVKNRFGGKGKKRPNSGSGERPNKRQKRNSASQRECKGLERPLHEENERPMSCRKRKRSSSPTSPPKKRMSVEAECSRLQVTTPPTLDRFCFLCELGRGSFGKVLLASDDVTKQKVAVKSVKKSSLLKSTKEDILVERRVLEMAVGCPFLTQAYSTFQTESHLYYVMEYLPGGDLLDYIIDHSPLDSSTITFFAAEIVCGLQFLHGKGIIHRDLKPSNILMDCKGHVKIADFGLALLNVFENETATGLAGTIGYIPPEMILNKAYNSSVDWWAFGVVLYELITGTTPFDYGKDNFEIARWAVHGSPDYPEWIRPAEQNILKRLLCKNPELRLRSPTEIRAHPFFCSVVWEDLEAGRVDPPSSVVVKTPLDNREKSFLLSLDKADQVISPEDQKLFSGFSFVSPLPITKV